MTSSDIRQSFLDFFRSKDHTIVPSAPVIPYDDPTLLFTNAGMNQFKDVFLGTGSREYVRAADTQKCIRVSGKHNDLEEVGRDTYHHTFFEMLGNWSFGDYYKAEAIAWGWELLTGTWGLDKSRLYATIFETDDEAATLWKNVTDIDHTHILRFGKKDNFWEMGDTGPCGPCSEIHIDLTADSSGLSLVNAGDPRVMEIWNLVFIQNNRKADGRLEDLPAKHVDTGMGFERVCAVLQGKTSNYDTDVFTPIIAAISAASGKPYRGEVNQVAMRVIADHVRMLTFAIADGAIPGNEGRAYVLRRILRRAARFGRNLGMQDPFIHAVAGTVIDTMGHVFPEIVDKREHIAKVIRSEEESFNATLDRGIEIFDAVVSRVGSSTQFPGEDAFRLYDTFGFPLDLTQLMAAERGMEVETTDFDARMKEQKERSRHATATALQAGETAEDVAITLPDGPPTQFVGYAALEAKTEVVAVQDTAVVLAASPFYAESGGQVGDTGFLKAGTRSFNVVNTRKGQGFNVQFLDRPPAGLTGMSVEAIVDKPRRHNIERNHSATHLVHEALRRVLGSHVHQQGSLVAPARLRFDFPHFSKVTAEEIRAIEEMVNGKIRENIAVHTEVDVPIGEARKIPNVKMFFGEKYGSVVRVVFIDEQYSVEFCGGTHVARTDDIGFFKIVSETGIASGVRRIEAVTGEGIQRFIDEQLAKVTQVGDQLARLIEENELLERERNRFLPAPVESPRRPNLGRVTITPGDPSATISLLERNLAEHEAAVERISRETMDIRKELSRHRVQDTEALLGDLAAGAPEVNGVRVVASRVDAASGDDLKQLGDILRARLGSGVGVLASVVDGKVSLVCVVTDDLVKAGSLKAGPIVGEIARQIGGGGGGKPHLATAGGKDIDGLDRALASVPGLVSRLAAHQ